MAEVAPQAPGAYPRVNAETINHYPGMIVSVVGTIGNDLGGGKYSFKCADQKSITLSTEHADPAELEAYTSSPEGSKMAVELVGMTQDENVLQVFVVRPLYNMNLPIYNAMLKAQDKYKSYFEPVEGATMMEEEQ